MRADVDEPAKGLQLRRLPRADAILEFGGQRFHGFGMARRKPGDPSVPVVGEELAAARALSDLSHQLIHAAADRIEAYEGRSVTLES